MPTNAVESSTALIKDIFEKNDPKEIGISFNAGKDSVVVMELILQTVGLETLRECRTFFFLEKDPEFEELTAFRKEYVRQRLGGVTLLEIPAQDGLCAGLWRVSERYGIKVVFMGTRRDDPSGRYQAGAVAATTQGWPLMTRVCPLFEWSYLQVWRYIRDRQIPFCSLYEKGYTSLGSPADTKPNADLLHMDGTYKQAWTLVDGSSERNGREKK
uniref:FAD synthase n=1 Tax=Angomonas desouzai TaxID=59800 RepID=T1YUH5_9TRYP|nr:FAD synthetase [Angomonas desouzai]